MLRNASIASVSNIKSNFIFTFHLDQSEIGAFSSIGNDVGDLDAQGNNMMITIARQDVGLSPRVGGKPVRHSYDNCSVTPATLCNFLQHSATIASSPPDETRR